jgi:predicted RNA-binding protein YlqC (UPF0109 family)
MPKRRSKNIESPEQLEETQVADWNFSELLNTDIKELEIGDSLRRLGNIRVMDLDFKNVIPVVKKTANIEIDVIGGIKRIANYRVIDWDFKASTPTVDPTAPPIAKKRAKQKKNPPETQALIEHLKNFLQYVAVNLIDEPSHAQIKVMEISPGVLRIKLVLVKRDVAMLIGMEGHTAAAIRSILKAIGRKTGVDVLLQILSHEEDVSLAAREAGK